MFDSIAGQENAKKHIEGMIASDRVPHSLLFAGPYGTGKGETALGLARRLLCKEEANGKCGCNSCKRAGSLEHPDLHVLFPFRAEPKEAKDRNKWVDDLVGHRKSIASDSYSPIVYRKGEFITRGLLSEIWERLYEGSLEGGKRVLVIFNAENLHPSSVGLLLKVMEEPPPGVHFILTAERVSSVTATIVSRCSILKFGRLKDIEIIRWLEEKGMGTPESRSSAAELSEGSIKRARMLVDERASGRLSLSFGLYNDAAVNKIEEVVSRYHSGKGEWESPEELVNGFVVLTRWVLERKSGLKTVAGANTEKLAALADIQAIHTLSSKLEDSLEMLGRNVNPELLISTLLYQINDTYRKKTV